MPPGLAYRSAIASLRRVQAELQRGTNDFEGHRQPAIDACTAALKELEAIQGIVIATATNAPSMSPTNIAPPSNMRVIGQ
jgi:hypothetical protein